VGEHHHQKPHHNHHRQHHEREHVAPHHQVDEAEVDEDSDYDTATMVSSPAPPAAGRVEEYTGPAVKPALSDPIFTAIATSPPPLTASQPAVSAGFDTSGFPGLAKMAALKKSSNFKFTGFYLGPAPSHPASDWMAHRADLEAQGWGFAPVFLGRQTTGPGSHAVSVANGVLDGKTAATLMKKAGFPADSYVYLDLEEGAPLSSAHKNYAVAWAKSLKTQGYNPGVYCSFTLASAVAAAIPEARIWAFHVQRTSQHRVSGSTFSTAPPSGSKFSKAFIWQYDDTAQISNGMVVDLNTALSADPSKP